MYQLRAGLRYDNMIERFNLLSPRLSGTIGFFNQFKLRGAWGLSYKAPSMITLYPGPIYFDIENLSYYDPKPEERLAVVTSYVFKPQSSLKPGKGETREISLEWSKMGYTIKATGYQKIQTRGISAITQLVVLENQHYKIIDEPVGKPPVVVPDSANISYMPRTYSAYGNNDRLNSTGIELDINTPRIKATNTSFNIRGQWINSKSINDVPSVRISNTSISQSRYGVYGSVASQNQICTANITAIQQLADLRMMITLTSEFNIYSKITHSDPSLLPVGYYGSQGNYIEIPEQDRNNPEYADLVLNANQFTPSILPFYPNFHLQIRKETRQGHSFSFYANNCLWYNPYVYDTYSKLKSRLNGRISFGFGIGLKL
jgi:ferric enterobactin receptor